MNCRGIVIHGGVSRGCTVTFTAGGTRRFECEGLARHPLPGSPATTRLPIPHHPAHTAAMVQAIARAARPLPCWYPEYFMRHTVHELSAPGRLRTEPEMHVF